MESEAEMGGYDLIVVGSGGAAMAAGIEARARGKRVLLIEHGPLGGTCLNVGCIPSKYVLAAAGYRQRAASSPFAGVHTSAAAVAMGPLLEEKQQLIEHLRQAKYVAVAGAHGFPVLQGHARFVDAETLEVDGTRLRAPAYVIATGVAPHVPDLPGITGVDYLTSTSALDLEQLPASLVVVGGGYVGLEQAQLWSRLGAEVTLLGRVAPQAEPEVADVARRVLRDEGITIVEERAVQAVDGAGTVRVTTSTGRQVLAERILVATGRSGATTGLGLHEAGVTADGRGFIVVDDQQRTTNPRVFAAGDVSGAPQFVYVAAQSGRVAAAGALGEPSSVDYTGLPAVVFTTPQLAQAGLTEAEAIERGYRCDFRVLSAQDIPRALVNQDTRGVLKIVMDADTRRVLGVHAALDGAGDLILAATYAIKFGLTVDDLADTWAPYLTTSEALRIAATLFRTTLPTSCCT